MAASIKLNTLQSDTNIQPKKVDATPDPESRCKSYSVSDWSGNMVLLLLPYFLVFLDRLPLVFQEPLYRYCMQSWQIQIQFSRAKHSWRLAQCPESAFNLRKGPSLSQQCWVWCRYPTFSSQGWKKENFKIEFLNLGESRVTSTGLKEGISL